jgi:hypothetical protein
MEVGQASRSRKGGSAGSGKTDNTFNLRNVRFSACR